LKSDVESRILKALRDAGLLSAEPRAASLPPIVKKLTKCGKKIKKFKACEER